jgi:hypothetical protein
MRSCSPTRCSNLIGLVEQEAARYVNGERVQLELMPKAETSANAKADFNDRAAAAEVASTRKPKGRKPKKGVDFIPGPVRVPVDCDVVGGSAPDSMSDGKGINHHQNCVDAEDF